MNTPGPLMTPILGSELVDFSPEEPEAEERSSTDSTVDSFSISLCPARDIVNKNARILRIWRIHVT